MIAIVDYNAGNLRSVELAIARTGRTAVVTQDADKVRAADRVIFPGVGAAGAAMGELARLGLDEALRDAVRRNVPVLGICLGTQIILDASEEDGGTSCLGIIPGRVKRFPEGEGVRPEARKIPHMGWNGVSFRRRHPVFQGVEDGDEFYFVHSYYPEAGDDDDVVATTDYSVTFSSVMARGGLVAVQFHPERSGNVGMRVIENFMTWDGRSRA